MGLNWQKPSRHVSGSSNPTSAHDHEAQVMDVTRHDSEACPSDVSLSRQAPSWRQTPVHPPHPRGASLHIDSDIYRSSFEELEEKKSDLIMSNPPQTLSVKRKRHELPVDALIFEHTIKRQRSGLLDERPKASPSRGFYFRRLTRPNDAPQQLSEPPTPSTERRFHLDNSAGTGSKRVFVETRPKPPDEQTASNQHLQVTVSEPGSRSPSPLRKRPGAGSALRNSTTATKKVPVEQKPQPTEEEVRQLEALSKQLDKEDNLRIPLPSISKHKPKAPAQRFADRNPEQAAAVTLSDPNGDAMDIDTDEYVIDTYIREPIIPDAEGKLSEPTGTIGFLVINQEDEEWWNGTDDSDKEFDTDEDDENAEDYYANDYPEDELSEDDEFGRDVYQKRYRKGSDDEEYNLDDDNNNDDAIGSGEDEDDLHFKMTVPKTQRVGYWGAYGE